MHITHRIRTAAVLLAAVAGVSIVRLLPTSTLAVVLSNERNEAEQAFQVALTQAAAEYQRSRSLPALKRRYEAEAREATEQVIPLMREKSVLRRRIAQIRAAIRDHQWWSAIDGDPSVSLTGQQANAVLLMRSVLQTVAVLRETFGNGLSPEGLVTGAARGVLAIDPDRHASAPDTRGPQILGLQAELSAVQEQLTAASAKADKALSAEHDAEKKLQRVQDQMARIRQMTEEVHAQVIRMQGALARIDAKIRSRIERELLEKGLLTPGTIDHTAIPQKPLFAWPAYGPIAAGFLAPGYKERFGIPHYGLDIVIGQGSPVYAAADGVVFLARDGGAFGYSYVLIGHQGNYATLYGHLSKISVTSGQDLRQGAFIGLSGGEVGAHGSGPTTTGPHLHFEVLENGTNIDPAGVLP